MPGDDMPDDGERNPEDRTISALLADLADDPEAPPSTVTAASVLAAARAAESSGTDLPPGQERRLRVVGQKGSTGPSRRRTALIALVAAASVAAVAAVVIPLGLNAGSISTSADGAQEAAATSAASEPAMEASPVPPAADLSAPAASPDRAGSAAGSADAAGTAASQADAGVLASAAATCWPELAPSAAEALGAALPPGAFGAPQPLLQECGPDPVAGATLPGTKPGTALVVRVSKAADGACARTSGEAVSRCTATGDGEYVGADSAGSTTAFSYGGGYEVAVGGPTPSTGVPAPPTGLTTEQLQSAAGALLGAVQ